MNKETTQKQRDFIKKVYKKNGYYAWKDSGKYVHKTIAEKGIYHSNREKYPLPFSEYNIHHIDGDKLNNRIDNL